MWTDLLANAYMGKNVPRQCLRRESPSVTGLYHSSKRREMSFAEMIRPASNNLHSPQQPLYAPRNSAKTKDANMQSFGRCFKLV